MKQSEIYRKAAEMVFHRQGLSAGSACWAIALAIDPSVSPFTPNRFGQSGIAGMEASPLYAACMRRAERFKPSQTEDPLEERQTWWWVRGENDERVLALCFMAAIAADEERSAK